MRFDKKQFFFFFLTAFFVFHTVFATPPASPTEMKKATLPTALQSSYGISKDAIFGVALTGGLLAFIGGFIAIALSSKYGDDCCKDAVAFCCPSFGTANCTQTFQQCPQCPADHNRDCKGLEKETMYTDTSSAMEAGGLLSTIGGLVASGTVVVLWYVRRESNKRIRAFESTLIRATP